MTTVQTHGTVDILALHDRAESRERNERIGMGAAGAVLAAAALFSVRPAARVLLAASGGLLLARGISGLTLKQLTRRVGNWFGSRADLERRFHDGEHDIVDAASFDSFPASDPPSYSPGAS